MGARVAGWLSGAYAATGDDGGRGRRWDASSHGTPAADGTSSGGARSSGSCGGAATARSWFR